MACSVWDFNKSCAFIIAALSFVSNDSTTGLIDPKFTQLYEAAEIHVPQRVRMGSGGKVFWIFVNDMEIFRIFFSH